MDWKMKKKMKNEKLKWRKGEREIRREGIEMEEAGRHTTLKGHRKQGQYNTFTSVFSSL